MKECLVLDHKYYNFFNPVQKIPPRVSKRTYRNGAPPPRQKKLDAIRLLVVNAERCRL
jgi:hypothetical protein